MADEKAGKPAPASGEAASRKPAAKDKSKEGPGAEPRKLRRRLVWACIWGYLGVNLLMFLRFFFPRTLFEPSTRFSIGYPSDFNIGVDTRLQQQFRIWVVRSPARLFVIYARCTHLGCTPDWKEAENKFKCPCHGSGFDNEGINFEGPAPRPMDRAHVELDATGQVVVDTNILYVRDPTTGRDEFEMAGAYLDV
jgi:cytochrome b6-f complex iron-sulfur subunit